MVLIATVVASAGCVRAGFGIDPGGDGVADSARDGLGEQHHPPDGRPAEGSTDGTADIGADLAAAVRLGSWAATLPVPPCPAGPVLVVDTVADELDGGSTIDAPAQAGAQLSLVEALWIAANRAGPDTIRFDAAVFPVDAPGWIALGKDRVLPSRAEGDAVCIDGRDRGVVVEWQGGAMATTHGIGLPPGSLMVGLTLLRTPYELGFSDAQVAGCRFNSDGAQAFDSGRPWATEPGPGAVLGPGNIFGGAIAARVFGGAPTIEGNYLGFDPLTGLNVGLAAAFDFQPDVAPVIRDNVVATSSGFALAWHGGWDVKVEGNYFGVDREGLPLPPPAVGIVFDAAIGATTGTITVGPGNVVRNVDTAIVVALDNTTITRNVISGNQQGITFSGVGAVKAPTVAGASATGAWGSCPGDGAVEVFADSGDQGEHFLGTVACSGASWIFAGAIPFGRNVTATFTDSSGRTSAFSTPAAVR